MSTMAEPTDTFVDDADAVASMTTSRPAGHGPVRAYDWIAPSRREPSGQGSRPRPRHRAHRSPTPSSTGAIDAMAAHLHVARHRPRRSGRGARPQRRRVLRHPVRLRPHRLDLRAAELAAHGHRARVHPQRQLADAARARRRRSPNRPPSSSGVATIGTLARDRRRQRADSPYETALAAHAGHAVERVDAHPRRRDHDHVHVGHDRPAEGGDDHPRHELLELRQPRHPGRDRARHGPPQRAAAVPHRRAQLLLQPGAPRRRHGRDPQDVRPGRDAAGARRPGAGHHPLLRRAGAVPVHDAAPRLRRHRPLAPADRRRRRGTVRARRSWSAGPSAACCWPRGSG